MVADYWENQNKHVKLNILLENKVNLRGKFCLRTGHESPEGD
jgi:hypothetical protein